MIMIKMVHGINLKKFLNLSLLIFLLTSNILNAETKPKPWIGIEFADITDEFIKINNLDLNTPKNIIITGVVKGSAADEAKIIPGDVVISMDNKPTNKMDDLVDILLTKHAEDVVALKIYREGKTLIKKVKLKKYPDPGYKPSWLAGSKILKNPPIKQKTYGLDVVFFANKDLIAYPKYFSKDIIRKYDHDNFTVACIVRGSNTKLKLYDQLISIDNKPAKGNFQLSEKPVNVKIKRNNRTINLKITPTQTNLQTSRSDCTPEFVDYDCAIDTDAALKIKASIEKDSSGRQVSNVKKGLALKKALNCYENVNANIIPFHKIFIKAGGGNIIFDDYSDYLIFLQYSKEKNLSEINSTLKKAKIKLKEFEEFQEIYPNHSMSKAYNRLLDRVASITSFAAGTYSEDFKSTKDDTIQADYETVELTKAALNKIIQKENINSLKAIKFLTSKYRYFLRANEQDYIVKMYNKARKNIDWKKDNLDKYFDDIYDDLSSVYSSQGKIDLTLEVLQEGIKIAEVNYDNLYFKNAYSDLIFMFALQKMTFKFSEFSDEAENFYTKAKKHLSNLDSLSTEDHEKMLKIGKDYYIDTILNINFLNFSLGVKDSALIYPLKGIEYIKANPKYNFDISYSNTLVALLEASIMEDNIQNFTYAKNEIDIYISKSAGDRKKLRSLLNISGQLLYSYDKVGFYSDGSEYINFIEKTFDLKTYKKNPVMRASMIMHDYYSGVYAKREGNIKKAKLIFEEMYKVSKLDLLFSKKNSSITTEQTIAILKVVPELYEIYYQESNYEKLNEYNQLFYNNGFDKISKKNLKETINFVGVDSLKIFNIFLKNYNITNNTKKFNMTKSFLMKEIMNYIGYIKKDDQVFFANSITNRQTILTDISNIAVTLISSGHVKDGKELLNKIYPIIIEEYNKKSSQLVWNPNIEDNIFGSIYLEVAEDYFQEDKTFINKAYTVAQAGKNLFTSRDVSKAIAKKSFKDPEGLIEKYENIKRELSVNLRSKQFAPKETSGDTEISEKLNQRNRELQGQLVKLEKQIKTKIPAYFKLKNIQTVKISEIQSLLQKDEILLDYYFYDKDVRVALITKDSFEILSNKINLQKLNNLNKKIRNSLIPSNGAIQPYEVNKSFDLNNATFSFLQKKTNKYNNIIVIPDGPLNSIPLHALAYSKSNNCLDCRNIKFNLDNYQFNYFPSVETFSNIDTVAQEFKTIKLDNTKAKLKNAVKTTAEVSKEKTLVGVFKKITEITKNKNKKEVTKKRSKIDKELFYLGVGDPDLYSKNQAKKVDQNKKVTMLRSLFENGKINSESIKEIYGPVDGSAEEIKQVADYLSPLKSKILLRNDAKELNLKELDLSTYKIIHFATHGEISGAIKGINEPFLVLSPPSQSSSEDGLLTMSEIMSFDTNADLVVLSACNTAAGDESGSEGFSGLAKSFFMSGAKSVLVSNWYVETYSAKELVISLFKNLKDNPNSSISNGLNMTMLNMVKNEKERSHPMFWAPFVVVGKNQPLFF
jgi:CHAT domain-containing protein